ncbi:MAG TPA: hypothetical protein VFM18_18930 [Methanosarcina sp.]|nr:hypothetical protein [Methanosarcina sp.]
MYGLEACINVTDDYDKDTMWKMLQGQDTSGQLNRLVSAILLRARANSHRHYEVYTVSVDSSITKEDLIEMFKENPQGMADLVRERGNKIYSDRMSNGGTPKIV